MKKIYSDLSLSDVLRYGRERRTENGMYEVELQRTVGLSKILFILISDINKGRFDRWSRGVLDLDQDYTFERIKRIRNQKRWLDKTEIPSVSAHPYIKWFRMYYDSRLVSASFKCGNTEKDCDIGISLGRITEKKADRVRDILHPFLSEKEIDTMIRRLQNRKEYDSGVINVVYSDYSIRRFEQFIKAFRERMGRGYWYNGDDREIKMMRIFPDQPSRSLLDYEDEIERRLPNTDVLLINPGVDGQEIIFDKYAQRFPNLRIGIVAPDISVYLEHEGLRTDHKQKYWRKSKQFKFYGKFGFFGKDNLDEIVRFILGATK